MVSVHPRIRIGIVLVLAFAISSICMRYAQSPSEGKAPTIELKNIVKDFSAQISHSGEAMLASIKTIQIPQLITLSNPTLQTNDSTTTSGVPGPGVTGISQPTPTLGGWIRLPTVTPIRTFPTTILTTPIVPTYSYPTIKVPTQIPTTAIEPTSKPEPTAVPQLPPITTDTRPGSSVDDIYADVAKRMCVPAALMKAIQSVESGDRVVNFAKSNLTYINTYGWWNTDRATQSDYYQAIAYSAQSGKAPPDSKFAGIRIATPIDPTAPDQYIMGILAISQEEQDKSFKNTSKIITTGKIDRRVLYDNVLIFASITLNKVGNLAETGCGDWSFRAIARAACKHAGKCTYYGNYCVKICNLYNSFSGTHYDCNNAPSLMVANGDDGQCTLK